MRYRLLNGAPDRRFFAAHLTFVIPPQSRKGSR
jgi:hypothetical protein